MIESKTTKLKTLLVKEGVISDNMALQGKVGFRTNRLAGMIHRLREQGWIINTRELVTKNNTRIDTIYQMGEWKEGKWTRTKEILA